MRLFVGVRPGPEILEHLIALQKGLPGRLIPPEQLHLTLKFYGEVDNDEALKVRLGELADFPTCQQPLGRFMAFPTPRRARLTAIGAVKAVAPLQAVWEFLGPEERGFRPHITLSRFGAPVPFEERSFPALTLKVAALTLFRSHLGPSGSHYEILQEFPLAAPVAS